MNRKRNRINLGLQLKTNIQSGAMDADDKKLLSLVNEYRQSNGKIALAENEALHQAAMQQVEDWNQNKPDHPNRKAPKHTGATASMYNAHLGLTTSGIDVSTIADRVNDKSGHDGWFYTAENGHFGSTTPEDTLNGWKASPGHNQIMLRSFENPNGQNPAHEAGIAHKDGTWAIVFGVGPNANPKGLGEYQVAVTRCNGKGLMGIRPGAKAAIESAMAAGNIFYQSELNDINNYGQQCNWGITVP